jgi:superfamily II DNA or RNA helicase
MRSAEQLEAAERKAQTPREQWPADRRILYVIDAMRVSHDSQHLVLEIMTDKQGKDGSWLTPKRLAYRASVWMTAPDARDRDIARLLLGVAPTIEYGNARSSYPIAPHAMSNVLSAICATGRASIKVASAPLTLHPVHWDTDENGERAPSWRFVATMHKHGAEWELSGKLVRGDEQWPLSAVRWMHPSGVCVLGNTLGLVSFEGQWPLIRGLWEHGELPVGDNPAPALERMLALPRVPALELPPELSFATSTALPLPGVRFVADPMPWRRFGAPMLGVEIGFRYGGAEVRAHEPGATKFDASTRTVHHRSTTHELAAIARAMQLGVARSHDVAHGQTPYVVPRASLRRIAQLFTAEGWWVEADGHAFRQPGAVRARVSSGVDWFDLDGAVSYGDVEVPLADILDAQRRGDELLLLPGGGYGLLPHDWLNQLGPLLSSGERAATGTRFKSSQLALLDALVSTLPHVDVDATFARQREALRGFTHVAPADPPASFTGALRSYQREGLGWMHFLRTFGFGGCLADDMGLGKTIQVLALLETRRVEGHGPSLVVVPRSLVFNWINEAARFAPALRVVDWSSAARLSSSFDATDFDVALVTYGTLRRDAVQLAERHFDYVILDEAQAIKNRGTATAKACRVLRASHRLAMSGTPVENRVEELWSLLDFLNPGMLGASSRFATALRSSTASEGVDDVLSRALRPVILRRTKAAVAKELPARMERTLRVELEPKQRAFYEQVRKAVRSSVLSQVEQQGIGKSKLHILEGLLRLRQAACHPVLADPRKGALPSAKLEALVPALLDIAKEGNKALVFSQFTSFLALVRAALEAEGLAYEYLDGSTKDRQARVERFQSDAACPVFLISLKAGGHGLNLTAADYVYLLDPWWNPAVEAQAIDRAHRIGRTRTVVATRLVARDTIEEKILTLQENKRALADAILSADRGGLASIGAAELELLLG